MAMNNSSAWKKIRAAVLARDNHICAYCLSDQANTVDHVVPRSKGGTDDLDNLVAACMSCNSSKQARS
ncbi:MAG: HNH endonuclease, partial [Fluviibacter sp.]